MPDCRKLFKKGLFRDKQENQEKYGLTIQKLKFQLPTVSFSDIFFLKMRVFINKWFGRWARTEHVPDSALLRVTDEVLAGQVEADLGGCLFKKL